MSSAQALPPADFDELADWLVSVGSQFSPSELHGAISGAVAGSMRLPQIQWAQFGLAVMGAEAMMDGADAVLGGLANEVQDRLGGQDLDFQPFLPDDDYELDERTRSLADWCRGFLGGFAEAQSRQAEMADQFAEGVEEALRDIAAIAQASAGVFDEDYEDQDVGGTDWLDPGAALDDDNPGFDASERDYFEIVEYVRLAALTVFTEVGWVERGDTGSREQPTLH